MTDITTDKLRELTTTIVAAHAGNNVVPISDLPIAISQVYSALQNLKTPAAPVEEKLQPAVPIRKSVTADYIICLEDGKKLKMLKRHLATSYNLTPEQYRERWSLPNDYPMVAPNYAARRSELAKKIGLGRKAAPPPPTPEPAPAAAKRGRPKKATSKG